jgi:hypothetical protein
MSSATKLALLSLLVPLLHSCKEKSCFVGDENAAPEIEAVYLDENGQMQSMVDGQTVPLIFPPQGGKVLLVGVRARNLDGCPINITTALIDPCSGIAAAGPETRPLTLEPGADGWLVPPSLRTDTPLGIEGYSNLASCPRANIDRDINGEPHQLQIVVEDKKGRTVQKTLAITPVCSEPEYLDQCLCECRSDYDQGADCNEERPDAGAGSCDAG